SASYLVGGAVRDLMLGRTPRDYDIVTELSPPAVLKVLALGDQRGGRFGSLRVPGLALEIVSTREEAAYLDRRRPSEVRFGASIRDDLRRRDFTINAMAVDRQGRLIDPFDGRTDLERSLLRCVGSAEERLSEDLLRIVRAYRFAAELELRIAPSVRRAARSLGRELGQLAPERLGQEMLRLLDAPGRSGHSAGCTRTGSCRRSCPSGGSRGATIRTGSCACARSAL
ncbi:tRNA CCA-pyrophosphorylase, partial [mine drainage metagenome]